MIAVALATVWLRRMGVPAGAGIGRSIDSLAGTASEASAELPASTLLGRVRLVRFSGICRLQGSGGFAAPIFSGTRHFHCARW